MLRYFVPFFGSVVNSKPRFPVGTQLLELEEREEEEEQNDVRGKWVATCCSALACTGLWGCRGSTREY